MNNIQVCFNLSGEMETLVGQREEISFICPAGAVFLIAETDMVLEAMRPPCSRRSLQAVIAYISSVNMFNSFVAL